MIPILFHKIYLENCILYQQIFKQNLSNQVSESQALC